MPLKPIKKDVQYNPETHHRRSIRGVKTSHWPDFEGKLWQRNYWEHVIRNEQSLNDIAQYIINNPQSWETDQLRIKP